MTMKASFNIPICGAVRGAFARALPAVAAAALLPLAALAAGPADYPGDYMDHGNHHPSGEHSPLIDKVYDLNKRYTDINVALHQEKGWVVGTPCVSGPDTGAMGFHIVNPGRLADGIIDPEFPEALIYEPLPNGSFRLVGLEFIEDAADWAARNPNGPPPSLDGNLMNLVGEPNRYGLHAFYELHVWAFEDNPKGAFADWNTRVSCESVTRPPR
jgi:hypothetical protein